MPLYIIRQGIAHLEDGEWNFLCTGTAIEDRYYFTKSLSKYQPFCKACLKKCKNNLLNSQQVAWLTGMQVVDIKRATDNRHRGGKGPKALEFEQVNGKRMISYQEALRWIKEYQQGAFK